MSKQNGLNFLKENAPWFFWGGVILFAIFSYAHDLFRVCPSIKNKNGAALEEWLEATDDFADVRFLAALQWVGQPVVDLLVTEVVQSDSSEIKRALVFLGDPAVPPLIENLEQNARRVDDILARMGPSAMSALVETLKTGSFDLCKGAAGVLEDMHYSPDHDEDRMRYYAAQQRWGDLRKCGVRPPWPLVAALQAGNPATRRQAAQKILELGYEDAANETVYAHVVLQDWNKLAEMGVDAVEPLIKLFSQQDPDVQAFIIYLLGESGSPPAISGLLNIMQADGMQANRWKACVVLCDLPLKEYEKNQIVSFIKKECPACDLSQGWAGARSAARHFGQKWFVAVPAEEGLRTVFVVAGFITFPASYPIPLNRVEVRRHFEYGKESVYKKKDGTEERRKAVTAHASLSFRDPSGCELLSFDVSECSETPYFLEETTTTYGSHVNKYISDSQSAIDDRAMGSADKKMEQTLSVMLKNF